MKYAMKFCSPFVLVDIFKKMKIKNLNFYFFLFCKVLYLEASWI